MRDDERRSLRERFRFRCGYCGVRESDVGSELTVDHFQPRSKGGADEADNWVYCCHACNEFKGDYWQPDSSDRILHPLRDDPALHIVEESDGTLRGSTETGRFHIERLRLNRGHLVQGRRERHRQKTIQRTRAMERDRLKKLLERIRAIIARIREGT